MSTLTECRESIAGVDLTEGLSFEQIEARLHVLARMTEVGQRGLAFYLLEVDERRLYQLTNHHDILEYADMVLGLERRRVGELLAVGRKLKELPAIDAALCEQRLSWSKVLLLSRIVVPEHEEAWIERAREKTVRELRLEVKLAKPGSAPRAEGSMKGLPNVRFAVSAQVDVLTHEKIEKARQKLRDECGREVSYGDLFCELAEIFLNLEADGTVPGRKRVDSSLYRVILKPGSRGGMCVDSELGLIPIIVPVGPEEAAEREADRPDVDRPTPPALRRVVIQRDAGRCRCCGRSKALMVHHIRYRSHGGATEMWNLITLCTTCHSRVHDGVLILEGSHADDVRFVDRDGNTVRQPRTEPPPELAMPITPPARAPDVSMQPQPGPSGDATVPDEIDRAWWRRNAHRIRFRNDLGLVLKDGVPLADAQADRPAPTPLSQEQAFRGIAGQDALLERLTRRARGRRARGECFPHTLLYGPPGTGKTSLAKGIARCFGARFHRTSGPLLKDLRELVALLADLRRGDTLFIDEVHAVPGPVLEALYEAMSEGQLSLTIQCDGQVHTTTLLLPAFTVLAATTEDGDLTQALRSRFVIRECIGYYDEADLAAIVATQARDRSLTLSDAAARELAAHARGTPREALRLLEGVLDEATCDGVERVEVEHVKEALTRMGYDAEGLEPAEQQYMALLRSVGEAVPLARLARMLGSTANAILANLEPYLFRRGLVRMTARGRVAVTPAGART